MKDYLKNLFSREFLEDAVQNFYDEYDQLAKDGLTADEKIYLEKLWDEIEKRGNERLDQLQNDLGVDLSDKTSGGSLGSEGITRATEEQFSEYLGINRALWDINKQQLEVLKSTNKASIDYLMVSNGQLVQLISIQENTLRTADKITEAVIYLKSIDDNNKKKYVG